MAEQEAGLLAELDQALTQLEDDDFWLGPKDWARSALHAVDAVVQDQRDVLCAAWLLIPDDRRDDSQAIATAVEAIVGTALGLPRGHEVVGLITSIVIRRGLDRICA
jgi:hypothetical protein